MIVQPQSRFLKHSSFTLLPLGNSYTTPRFLHITARVQWNLRDTLGALSQPVPGMTHSWDRQLWRSTAFVTPAEGPRDSTFQISVLWIFWYTMRLHFGCYNPETWYNRGTHLSKLGYPELAAGDAYKADLLAKARLNSINKEIAVNESIRLHELRRRSLTLLGQSLVAMWEHVGLREVCKEGLALSPLDGELQELSKRAEEILELKKERAESIQITNREFKKGFITHGKMFPQQYPFMSAKHMSRDKNGIDTLKKTLENISSKCSLASRSFPNTFQSQSEGFGIYATTDMGPNTRLFDDETVLGVTDTDTSNSSISKGQEICENCCGSLPRISSSRVKSTCCSSVYCSKHCRETAARFYHSAKCGRDFKWLFKSLDGISGRDAAMKGPMWLRVLAICIQSDCHPLDHPLIARLIPPLPAPWFMPWTLRDHIVNPNLILEQLGVDIFEDLRFDTWVLHHVDFRLLGNQRNSRASGRRPLSAVNSLLPFFNHSCEPNASWYVARTSEGATAHDSTTITFMTTKPIKKGEEIFIDQKAVSGIPEKAKRQEHLADIIPRGKCACTRCQRET